MNTPQSFIEKVASLVRYHAFMRGYKYPSAIIAQMCLESNYGNSQLSAVYHNYFGLKCGAYWSGQSVNMSTKEEYTVGTQVQTRDNFRVYDSLENGIRGYFDFIDTKRYNNLREAVSPEDYLNKIKADGYATSSKYVENNTRVIKTYSLEKYDWPTEPDLNMAIDVIAEYVLAHKFGNGHEVRKEMIYDLVRVRVNEKAGGH